MLKDILKVIKRDGYISISHLARELKTPEAMVEEGINQLLRMGYLINEDTGKGCASTCAGCPFAKTCNKEIVNIFRISDKADNVCDLYNGLAPVK